MNGCTEESVCCVCCNVGIRQRDITFRRLGFGVIWAMEMKPSVGELSRHKFSTLNEKGRGICQSIISLKLETRLFTDQPSTQQNLRFPLRP